MKSLPIFLLVFANLALSEPLQVSLSTLDLKQCSEQGYLHNLMDDMRWYRVNNSGFHAGDDIYDHSAWSALAMEKWFAEGHPWVKNLTHLKDTAILAAFLHDIGKVGDLNFKKLLNPGVKPEHPESGFAYYVGKNYHLLNKPIAELFAIEKTKTHELDPSWYETFIKGPKANFEAVNLDFKQALRSCPMSDYEAALIAISTGMHYKFGDMIVTKPNIPMAERFEKYYKYLLKLINDGNFSHLFKDKKSILDLINFCIAVSSADFKGSQPVKFISERFSAINHNARTLNKILPISPYDYHKGDNSVLLRDELLLWVVENYFK